jgi:hypothetical protein
VKLFEHYIAICCEEASEVILELSVLKEDLKPPREAINRLSVEFTELFASYNKLLAVISGDLTQGHAQEIAQFDQRFRDPFYEDSGYNLLEWDVKLHDVLANLQQTLMKSLRFGLGNKYGDAPTNLSATLTLMTDACYLMNYFDKRMNTQGVLYCSLIQEKKLARIDFFFSQSVRGNCLDEKDAPLMQENLLGQLSAQKVRSA